MTPTTFPALMMGTTISLALSLSHAMWPGKRLISGMSWVVEVEAARPHTPFGGEKDIV